MKIGDYKFWLDIEDSIGNTFKSDTISFKVILPEMGDYSNMVEMNISTAKNEISDTEEVKICINFINKSKNKLTFLKPSFDSFYGWTNPTYYFIVKEKLSECVIPLSLRSGTMEIPKYDDSKMFSIDSNKRESISIALPSFPKLSNPSDYTIQLIYLVRNKQIGKSGTILNEEMNWDKDVFVGLIESNIIDLNIVNK